MDDPQSVEADNDFSNRRMTRSALKRASGALENDPEQKKVISGQNLGVSKQKPGGLSKKKPRGPSKTSDNQQQQLHRKGNDDNQQQQHEEGKGVAEVRKSLTGEALKAFQEERIKRRRKLTPEEAANYYKKARESEGFDVVALPYNIECYSLIRPVKQSAEEQLVIEKCSKSAIARYNKEHKSKYRFVKLIKTNYKLGSGMYYYITFVAEEKDVGYAKNFQAFVRYQFEKITVQFCRLEKPPNEEAQYNFKHEDLKAYNKNLAEGRVEEEESNRSTVNGEDKDEEDEIVEEKGGEAKRSGVR